MLSKRKLLLNKEDDEKIDNEIEEIVLDDDEIDKLFEVRKKGSKSKLNSKLKLKKKDNKQNSQKEKNGKQQIKKALNANQSTSDDDDKIVILDSDGDSIMQDDEILINNNESINNNKLDDDDEIIIYSNHNSPIKSTSTKRTTNRMQNLNSSFDATEYELPSSFNFVKTTRIKFRYKGTYHGIPFKTTDRFRDKFEEISQELSIDTTRMILMFDNKTISFEETPESLNIGICDIIDVFDKKEDENLVEDKEDPNLFKLKFRDCESRKRIQDVLLTMNRYDTFEAVFRKYADLKELNFNKIIFEFDGEHMTANQKPDDLDMESDSLIDVKMKKT